MSARCAVLAAVLISGCGEKGPPPEAQQPAVPVKVAAVIRRDVPEMLENIGQTRGSVEVEIRARIEGFIDKVLFDEGKPVRKGEVLYEIDPKPFVAAVNRAKGVVASAQADLAKARQDVARYKPLVEQNAISREEYDARTSGAAQAEAAIKAAQAAVEQARLNLEWSVVRAPISGKVSRAEVTQGNLVQDGETLLTTVVSLDPIYVYFESDEQAYLAYTGLDSAGARKKPRNTRDPVRMGLANEQGYPHLGYLDFIDNSLDPRTGTIRARAVFSNKDRLFTPGLFARVQLIESGTINAVLVRDGAIGTDQDRKFVYVLKPDSTIDYRGVELGRIVDGLRIIRKGLTPGELVVINGLQRVRPGVKVTPTVTTMEASGDSMQTAQRGE